MAKLSDLLDAENLEAFDPPPGRYHGTVLSVKLSEEKISARGNPYQRLAVAVRLEDPVDGIGNPDMAAYQQATAGFDRPVYFHSRNLMRPQDYLQVGRWAERFGIQADSTSVGAKLKALAARVPFPAIVTVSYRDNGEGTPVPEITAVLPPEE